MRFRRPKLVDDAIKVDNTGLHVGVYGSYRLFSAYQPIYAMNCDGGYQIEAFEGLIRPFLKHEIIRPDVFLDSLDDRDFLFIECMCRALHLRNYRKALPTNNSLFVNIDLARYQGAQDMRLNFDIYCDRAAKHGLSIDKMVFEVLESEPANASLLEYTRDMMRERSVRIAVDDYGQKHSNLERCNLLKPDILKIDRDHFLLTLNHASLRKLLKLQIRQFHDQGTTVLIEGIETSQQLNAAVEYGADLFQGFGFSKPEILPMQFDEAPRSVCEAAKQYGEEAPIVDANPAITLAV